MTAEKVKPRPEVVAPPTKNLRQLLPEVEKPSRGNREAHRVVEGRPRQHVLRPRRVRREEAASGRRSGRGRASAEQVSHRRTRRRPVEGPQEPFLKVSVHGCSQLSKSPRAAQPAKSGFLSQKRFQTLDEGLLWLIIYRIYGKLKKRFTRPKKQVKKREST